jgi:hypothetical protein
VAGKPKLLGPETLKLLARLYPGTARAIAERGEAFTLAQASLRPDLTVNDSSWCYGNAADAADQIPDLCYTEGFASYRGMGLWEAHAWLTDAIGNAFDPTWGHMVGSVYLGVQIPMSEVREREAEDDGIVGMALESLEYRKSIDPQTDFKPLFVRLVTKCQLGQGRTDPLNLLRRMVAG